MQVCQHWDVLLQHGVVHPRYMHEWWSEVCRSASRCAHLRLFPDLLIKIWNPKYVQILNLVSEKNTFVRSRPASRCAFFLILKINSQ